MYTTESTDRDTADRLLTVDSQAAEARSALATAAVHVARAEERSAALERVAADTAQQLMISAQLAAEMHQQRLRSARSSVLFVNIPQLNLSSHPSLSDNPVVARVLLAIETVQGCS